VQHAACEPRASSTPQQQQQKQQRCKKNHVDAMQGILQADSDVSTALTHSNKLMWPKMHPRLGMATIQQTNGAHPCSWQHAEFVAWMHSCAGHAHLGVSCSPVFGTGERSQWKCVSMFFSHGNAISSARAPAATLRRKPKRGKKPCLRYMDALKYQSA
jgi:hypothetical protein